MKRIIIAVSICMASIGNISAHSWEGLYLSGECGYPNQNISRPGCVIYLLQIHEDFAELRVIRGYHTFSLNLDVTFLEENVMLENRDQTKRDALLSFGPFDRGDTIVSLLKKGENIKTIWKEMLPVYSKGVEVQFIKIPNESEFEVWIPTARSNWDMTFAFIRPNEIYWASTHKRSVFQIIEADENYQIVEKMDKSESPLKGDLAAEFIKVDYVSNNQLTMSWSNDLASLKSGRGIATGAPFEKFTVSGPTMP